MTDFRDESSPKVPTLTVRWIAQSPTPVSISEQFAAVASVMCSWSTDVAFADEVPAERACLPPGGRRVHVPWFHSRGELILLLV